MSVNDTLAERGARYGKFEDHAKIAMALKEVLRYNAPPVFIFDPAKLTAEDMAALKNCKPGGYVEVSQDFRSIVLQSSPGWLRLAPDQQQALDTICDKIARILNGDPNYIDNWHDIQGYAKLIEDRLTTPQP